MRVIISLATAIIAVAAAAATPPTPLVEEDFEGGQFPPAGWTASGEGDTWSWINGGGFALGYAAAAYNKVVFTRLTSPTFNYTAYAVVRVEFRYCAWKTSSAQTEVEFVWPGGRVKALYR